MNTFSHKTQNKHQLCSTCRPAIASNIPRIWQQGRTIFGWPVNRVIQPFCSALASPVVLVRKKDNTMSCCRDYHNVNEDTNQNHLRKRTPYNVALRKPDSDLLMKRERKDLVTEDVLNLWIQLWKNSTNSGKKRKGRDEKKRKRKYGKRRKTRDGKRKKRKD